MYCILHGLVRSKTKAKLWGVRRSSRRVIPTSRTGTPIPPHTATMEASSSRQSRRQTQLSRIEMSEVELDDDDDYIDHCDLPGPFWEDRLSELADYRKLHGHCNVPRNCCQQALQSEWRTKNCPTTGHVHRRGNVVDLERDEMEPRSPYRSGPLRIPSKFSYESRVRIIVNGMTPLQAKKANLLLSLRRTGKGPPGSPEKKKATLSKL
jgi:hypothetical protein